MVVTNGETNCSEAAPASGRCWTAAKQRQKAEQAAEETISSSGVP